MNWVCRLVRNRRWRAMISRWRGGMARLWVADLELAGNARLGRGVVFETSRSIPGVSRIAVGAHCELEDGVRLEAWGGSIEIAANVFIGPGTIIYGQGGVSIGPDCLIAMHCRIVSSNHRLAPVGTPLRSQPDELLRTTLGRDVWLGAGVTVLGGVTIGDGCVVGAGAVVTGDLPAGAIACGVPARVQGWRPGAHPPMPERG